MNRADGAASEEEQDLQDIALAHKYRLSLTTIPTQSSFRVVAIVFYEGCGGPPISDLPCPVADIRCDQRQYLVGTNDEPGGFIGGSICAERAALVQLRFLPHVKVSKIVIVTDHEMPIAPGMLCREFMAGHAAVPWDVPIVLAGSGRHGEQWETTKTTLHHLYPLPSPYARLTASQANALGIIFSESVVEKTNRTTDLWIRESAVLHLLAAARKASHYDTRIGLHPIQYGAAVLFDDDTIVSGHQKKALEYGATLDAVTQLAPLIEKSKARPVALAQVDSHGVAHAPFAPARAYLSEHGYGDCRILIHSYQYCENFADDAKVTISGDIMSILVSDLAPVAPDMGDLWSC